MNHKPQKIKNFNHRVREIEPDNECITKIDLLYKLCLKKMVRFCVMREMNMIRNAVRLKIPSLHEIFTEFVTTYQSLKVDIETGYLCKDENKNNVENSPSFKEWIVKKYELSEFNNNKEVIPSKINISRINNANSNLNKAKKIKKIKKIKLMLISCRGKRIDKMEQCTNCGQVESPVWRYSESNRGVIIVCFRCKPGLLERSFGRKDAMDNAIFGGGFEGNRRKH